MRAQRLLNVMDQRHVGDVVQSLSVQHVHLAENLLDVLGAVFGQHHRALFLVLLEIVGTEPRDHLVDGGV